MRPDDLKLTAPKRLTAEERDGLGCLLRAAQRRLPRGQAYATTKSSVGAISAICTIIWPASKRSTKASAGCWPSSTRPGLADNTIVVYASDQGFYLGEHGWFDKRWIFEQSLRTPLLVRWPKVDSARQRQRRPGQQSRFCPDVPGRGRRDAAGRDAGPRSGPAVARAKAGRLAEEFLLPLLRVSRCRITSAPHYGVVTDRYKLVHFYQDADYWELFDLKEDPQELRSVFGQTELRRSRKGIDRRAGPLAHRAGRSGRRPAAVARQSPGGKEVEWPSLGPFPAFSVAFCAARLRARLSAVDHAFFPRRSRFGGRRCGSDGLRSCRFWRRRLC